MSIRKHLVEATQAAIEQDDAIRDLELLLRGHLPSLPSATGERVQKLLRQAKQAGHRNRAAIGNATIDTFTT